MASSDRSTVLVTGGAGYIGSHVVRLLVEAGRDVVVIDDLSTGELHRIGGVPFVHLDLASVRARARLGDTIRAHGVGGVVHLAAMKQVGESVDRPTWYFDRNIGGLTNLLAAMEDCDVRDLVFSSSAAVYGDVAGGQVREEHPCVPVNPYGQSKLVGEWMLTNAARAWGLRGISLRYFNVAGTGWPELRDRAETNLVPIVIRAVRSGRPVPVFGTDHPTADGSCVRDYIHVADLADAHVAALDHLHGADAGHTAVNLGTGRGTSVLEIVQAVSACAARPAVVDALPPRAGDPVTVVADPSRAVRLLGWRARRSVADAVRSAWSASLPADPADPADSPVPTAPAGPTVPAVAVPAGSAG
ncbi:UDP-glucose 4-epimerase GalE [Curtobacterium sp. 260]|uniref:UDP-glucose 4-epimerase GalE n=1 Tax=Curtobacterium sp. 260 TaxID=2817748 RepID=UPI0027885E9E|nr:UDP-glucose 4-epimerase GalE [Curtobacterium sp. 260]MDP9737185.1 UDP-glucose 4-epimerase [Curtobacterium sp. 260]